MPVAYMYTSHGLPMKPQVNPYALIAHTVLCPKHTLQYDPPLHCNSTPTWGTGGYAAGI